MSGHGHGKILVVEFVLDEQDNEQRAGYTDGQPRKIDDREALLPQHKAKSDFQVVLQHEIGAVNIPIMLDEGDCNFREFELKVAVLGRFYLFERALERKNHPLARRRRLAGQHMMARNGGGMLIFTIG